MARLAHVNIRTARFADTVAFYQRVLGFAPAPAATRPESTRHAWMIDGDGRAVVHVQEAADGGGTRGAPLYHHIAFDCDDADAWRARLAEAGEEHEELVFAAAGLLQFNLKDPNGLLVELTFRTAP